MEFGRLVGRGGGLEGLVARCFGELNLHPEWSAYRDAPRPGLQHQESKVVL